MRNSLFPTEKEPKEVQPMWRHVVCCLLGPQVSFLLADWTAQKALSFPPVLQRSNQANRTRAKYSFEWRPQRSHSSTPQVEESKKVDWPFNQNRSLL
jgi:hypothetical protein